MEINEVYEKEIEGKIKNLFEKRVELLEKINKIDEELLTFFGELIKKIEGEGK